MKLEGERLVQCLQKLIHFSVRVLAILMTFVIVWGVGDVAWQIYQRLVNPPFLLLDINEILAVFGAFMAVLIAIEIFINITIYLKDDVIHVKIVIATALMAVARKVIIFDYDTIRSEYVYATAAVVIALSFAYWAIHRIETKS